MKIYTTILKERDFYDAAQQAGVGVAALTTARGRGRDVTVYDVALTGSSKYVSAHRNANYCKAATYDEWGYFLAYLFRADPHMRTRYYKDALEFEAKTEGAYSLACLDTHA